MQAGEITYVDIGHGPHEKLGVAGAWVGTWQVKPNGKGTTDRPFLDIDSCALPTRTDPQSLTLSTGVLPGRGQALGMGWACSGGPSVLIAVSPPPRGTILLFIHHAADGYLVVPPVLGFHKQCYRMFAHLFGGHMGSSLSEWRCWVTGEARVQLREKMPPGSPRVCPHLPLGQHAHSPCR